MNRNEVLDVLRAHKLTLAQRFGVSELTLFGSVARDQANDDSDLVLTMTLSGTSSKAILLNCYLHYETC